MAKKKKSILKAGYRKGTTLEDKTFDELVKRRIKGETEVIAHDNYDDETMSFTLTVHYK